MAQQSAETKISMILVIAFTALILASLFLRHTLSALLTSLAIAYLLNPLLKYLEKRGFSRTLSITFIYGLLALIGMFSLFFLIPYIGHQLDALTTALPNYIQSLKKAIVAWKENLLPYYDAEDIDWMAGKATEALNKLLTEVSGKGYERLKGLLFALFDLLLAPILIFFLLYYKEEFKQTLLFLSPENLREELKVLGRKVNTTLERFILAMLVDCIIVGILCSITLLLLDIEFPFLNGMLAGFATIVPFLGAVISVVPPALIGYAQSGDLWIIPKVCAAYFIINIVVEGNIIKPLVMRGAMRLNPLVVVFAVMALGEIMGFWGIVLAIPLAAVVKLSASGIREMLTQRTGNEPDDI